jgi:hypothetical protein
MTEMFMETPNLICPKQQCRNAYRTSPPCKTRKKPPVTLTVEHCLKDSNDKDFTGQVLIVKANALMPEYRDTESQIDKCTHGNGARANAKGRSIFYKELASDKTAVYYRDEIEGIADIGKLPHWAKKR